MLLKGKPKVSTSASREWFSQNDHLKSTLHTLVVATSPNFRQAFRLSGTTFVKIVSIKLVTGLWRTVKAYQVLAWGGGHKWQASEMMTLFHSKKIYRGWGWRGTWKSLDIPPFPLLCLTGFCLCHHYYPNIHPSHFCSEYKTFISNSRSHSKSNRPTSSLLMLTLTLTIPQN